jgi:hypothetical protein
MHVVSQSDVICFIGRHVDEIGPLAERTLAQLGLASKAVVCVPGEMSTINALATMAVRSRARRVAVAGQVEALVCLCMLVHMPAEARKSTPSDLESALPEWGRHANFAALPALKAWQKEASWGEDLPANLLTPRMVSPKTLSQSNQTLHSGYQTLQSPPTHSNRPVRPTVCRASASSPTTARRASSAAT